MISKTKKGSLFAAILFLTLTLGCRGENEYYMKIRALQQEVISSGSSSAFEKLLGFYSSSDYWDRFYAIVFSVAIGVDPGSPFRGRVIELLVKALDDPDDAIRREAVAGIRDIGTSAVDVALPKLLEIVNRGAENDVTWYAATALGEFSDSHYTPIVTSSLFAAVKRPPAAAISNSAPQLRFYALNSLERIQLKHTTNVLTELTLLEKSDDTKLSEKVTAVVKAIQKSSKQ